MKKILSLVAIIVVAVLVGGVCGFFIGNIASTDSTTSYDKESVVGTYRAFAGTESESFFIFQKDGTYINNFFSASIVDHGIWYVEDGTVWIVSDRDKGRNRVILVPQGLLYGNRFFEKVK